MHKPGCPRGSVQIAVVEGALPPESYVQAAVSDPTHGADDANWSLRDLLPGQLHECL